MINFSRNEIGIGFSSKASESEFKVAENIITTFFAGRVKSCTRKGFWIVGDVKDLSTSDRAAFKKHVNKSSKTSMPNLQVVGPTL